VAGAGRKWLIGCGAGCGGLILMVIIISVVGGIWMTRPMSEAVKSQKALNEMHGSRETFVPGPQGITADRMEIFLEVRRTLMTNCAEFARIGEKFKAMDELDKQGDDVPKGEALMAVGGLMGSIMGLATELGKFTQARNEALLAGGMGQGEYIWIYVLAYNSWLGHPPNTSFDSEDSGGKLTNKEQSAIQSMVEHHVEALNEAGLNDRADVWEQELRRMERSETGVPFKGKELPDGLPDFFGRYEMDLQEVFCPETAGFELNQIKKKGLSFHSN